MRSVRYLSPIAAGDADSADYAEHDHHFDTDGPSILVETDDGERFVLTVDDDLRAAVAGVRRDGDPDRPDVEEPAVTKPSATIGPPLSPRDIQVRVRGGEAPEDLAADTDTPLDKVMRFAIPVLQERARIGDEARRSRARRDGDGALVPFGETVDRRFLAHGIDPGSVRWDSFRRPDGSWVVIATWPTGEAERHAHWAFSLTARTVLPADEIGADLLSDRPLRPVVRAVPDPSDDEPIAATESVYDQEATTYYSSTYSPAPTYPPAAVHDEPPLPLRLADPLPDVHDDAGEPDGPDDPDPSTTVPSRRSKTAREQTKIPSWDDILLGVRRKQD